MELAGDAPRGQLATLKSSIIESHREKPKMKKLFTVGILALCSLTMAIAKNYELTLSGKTKVGSLQLKPGQYTLKVQGDKAIFTLLDDAKTFTTTVKVEATDKKFDNTRVDASKQGDIDVVKDIELGGSKTRLQFGE
jgi:hypothetical protein